MLRPLKLLAPLWLVLLACADRAAPSAGDSRLPPGALVRIGTLAFRHPGTVALVASADGSKLIAASESSARVFDAASGDELARYDTHGRPAFSSDGRTMIGKRSIFDSALELRDAESGSTRSKLEYSGSVSAIALSADAARAAIARDQLLEFFDVASAATVRRMSIKYGQISALIFLPGTSSVACGGADGKIELLSVETEEVRVLREARSGAPRISALAHSADGRTLAAGDEEGNIF